MDWRILVFFRIFLEFTNIRQPMLKLKNILASIIYFDSDMSKSANTVVYFDWKTEIYIYVCGKCRTQFMLPNSSRRKFINMYIYDGIVSHIHGYVRMRLYHR
jgi:hypothetical protein